MDIGYKYNRQKVLNLISTEYTCGTKAGITYLSQYPDSCSNVEFLPVFFSLLSCLIYLGLLIRLTPTKTRQSDLAQENYWITQYVCMQQFGTIDIGTNIKSFWEQFCYEVKRYHFYTLIGIREIIE